MQRPRRWAAVLSRATPLCARLLLGLAGAAATSLAEPPAWAEPAPSKRIAVYTEGADAESVRSMVVALMPENVNVVEEEDFSQALKKAGIRKAIGALGTKAQRDKALKPIRKALSQVKAEAVILGIVQRTRGRKDLQLLYVEVSPGDPSVNEVIPLKKPEDDLLAIETALGPKLKEMAPAPKPEEPAPRPKPPPPKVEPPPDTPPEHDAGRAFFSAELGFELAARWFNYSDGVSQNLRPYSVFGAPAVAASAEVYPLAGTSTPVVRDLGITVGYARAFGLQSATEGGEPIGTTYQRFGAGLRVRHAFDGVALLPDAGPPVVGLSGGFRLITFSYDAPEALAPEVPDVSYALLRVGVDGRVPLGAVAALVMFEYLGPVSAGVVYDRFRDPSVAGIGLGGGVAVPVPALAGLEVRLLVEYTRFFSAFSPELGDVYVAGGALDELLGIRLAGAYIY